jgi:hypothetical protein
MKSFSPPRLASERERERWAGHEKGRYKVERKSDKKKRERLKIFFANISLLLLLLVTYIYSAKHSRAKYFSPT